jgi:hypothetical protein
VISAQPALRLSRRPGWVVALAVVVVGLPLVVAAIALRGERWYPVLDLAMTEFRVRDVGTSHTPLIGLPGRIGEYPEQGSHPGPLSFYLLAPVYRLFGASSWAMEAGTVVIHLGAITTALWIGHRRAGWKGVAAVGALLAVVIRGYGQVPLTQPWNPYLPLLAWIVVLLATWAVLCGDHLMLIPLVVAATLGAQTHVPYLLLGAGMFAVALGVVIARLVRAPAAPRRAPRRSIFWAIAAGVALWIPPLVDQLTNDPGNVRVLADHFGAPSEPVLGLGDGVRLALRHLDVWAGLAHQVVETGSFISTASAWRGGITLAVWIVAAVVAWRVGSSALRALHVTVAIDLGLGILSMVRIFGRPWFYLTLWAWGVTTVMAGAIAWTALAWWKGRARTRATAGVARVGLAAGAAALVVSVASTASFAGAEHPEERISKAVGALAAPTYQAVVDGVGAATGEDGVYLVRWSDAADIGSPGYGLLNELERRGLDVAADEIFHVQVTDHRVRPRAEATAQIHLATGGYVDAWRDVSDAVEVAAYDPRSDAERAEYRDARGRLVERMQSEGLADLVPSVDTNLFGLSIDDRLSPADQADLTRLLDLGQPMVVFIAPAPAEDDPTAL